MKSGLLDIVSPFHGDPKQLEGRVPQPPVVRILIVADPGISFCSVDKTSFGIGRVIDLIRTKFDPYVQFEVDLARLGVKGAMTIANPNPTCVAPKYSDFRFDGAIDGTRIIDAYDQIWCFGLAPNASAKEEEIRCNDLALEDTDLAALTVWMNGGGGLLAMGDHESLGAALCSQIPRVRSMRKWSSEQSVPPRDDIARHNTNRPQNERQDPYNTRCPDEIPEAAQADGIPQRIEWKGYDAWSANDARLCYRPHPLLCGGTLGVIDVLPDHQHEGQVFEDTLIALDKKYEFNGVSGDEFPAPNGTQPKPEAIAWATTLAKPPYMHFGENKLTAARFAVIGAYDGDLGGVGRVAVDSTWHHWFDMNILGFDAASTDYQKIIRYFRNCAVWLSRKGQRAAMFRFAAFHMVSHALYFEEFSGRADEWRVGALALDALGRLTSDCFVRDWLDAEIGPAHRALAAAAPPASWAPPPRDLARVYVMGAIVNELVDVRDAVLWNRKTAIASAATSIGGAVKAGVTTGLQKYNGALSANAQFMSQAAATAVSLSP